MIAELDAAPWDDEPSTAEEDSAVAEARDAIARGDGVDWDQVKAELSTEGNGALREKRPPSLAPLSPSSQIRRWSDRLTSRC